MAKKIDWRDIIIWIFGEAQMIPNGIDNGRQASGKLTIYQQTQAARQAAAGDIYIMRDDQSELAGRPKYRYRASRLYDQARLG